MTSWSFFQAIQVSWPSHRDLAYHKNSKVCEMVALANNVSRILIYLCSNTASLRPIAPLTWSRKRKIQVCHDCIPRGSTLQNYLFTQNLVRFTACTPTKQEMGKGVCKSGLNRVQPSQHFGLNEIHRTLWWPQMGIWHSGFQENRQIDGVWYAYATTQIQSKFGGSPAWKSVQSPILNPNCLVSRWLWISLMVLAKGVLHVCLLHQIFPLKSECCGKGVSSKECT